MTPEQKSRLKFDRQVGRCGWLVQDHPEVGISSSLGVAEWELPVATSSRARLLFVHRGAVGSVKGKLEGRTLTGVMEQSAKYSGGVPNNLPHFRLPSLLAHESTGIAKQFTTTNLLAPAPPSRVVFFFHRPARFLPLVSMQRRI